MELLHSLFDICFPYVAEFGTILLAGVLGGLIGLERELARKPAGLRTHVFVCAGSALFVMLSHEILQAFQHFDGSFSADPLRVLQAIVVGIGFLGAGTIIQNRDHHVEGLTTASSIFFTSAIGVAVALESYRIAILGTVFALMVLYLLHTVEAYLKRKTDGPPD